MAEFKFEITKHIATMSTNVKGWSKELNMVSWNGRTPKYDIREWSEDHQMMSKGITLSEEEIEILKNALEEL
ncbi:MULTISPECIES: YdbC family protein [Peptoniphilus]|uniref:YdbC family protein n=1 Tax=Peptoniphilus TaxID=162289 RepID=UPI0001DA9F6F|nr:MULTISPECIES: PC4/YdbC family ssDNA-binding protein [Peptoniphilus]EFI41574.1 hypothetical protein HMPREF0629_00196 [Peptoniphilus sp. oral taxon 386 str. F0131]